MKLKPGTLFQERYLVLEHLGQGGAGSVYKVEQEGTKRILALKLLLTANLDEDSIARFRREAKILSSMQNEHIVSFYHYGTTNDDIPYTAIEYLEGRDLNSLLNEERCLPEKRAVQMMKQICSGLSYAHKKGIIHRDLKPSNLILLRNSESDFVKIIDFGLARVDTSSDTGKLTKSGLLIGTPHYMSPEQAKGLPSDVRTDIYACGCILFRMLTGQTPFEADTPVGLLYKHAKEELPSFSSTEFGATCSAAVEAICVQATQKNPSDRYQTMDEMLKDLEIVEKGQHHLIATGRIKQLSRKQAARSPWSLKVVFIFTVCVVAAMSFIYIKLRDEKSIRVKTIQSLSSDKKLAEDKLRTRELQRLTKNANLLRNIYLANKDSTSQTDIARVANELLLLSMEQIRHKDFKAAEKNLCEAEDLAKKSDDQGGLLSRILITKARCELRNGKPQLAEDDARTAMNISLKIWSAESNYGNDIEFQQLIVRAGTGRFKEVKTELDKIAAERKTDPIYTPMAVVGNNKLSDGFSQVEILQFIYDELCIAPAKTSDANLERLKAMVSALDLIGSIAIQTTWLESVKTLKTQLASLQKSTPETEEIQKKVIEFERKWAERNAKILNQSSIPALQFLHKNKGTRN